jgi:hypothetical protein
MNRRGFSILLGFLPVAFGLLNVWTMSSRPWLPAVLFSLSGVICLVASFGVTSGVLKDSCLEGFLALALSVVWLGLDVFLGYVVFVTLHSSG